MFEAAKSRGQPETSISLMTAKGREIDNIVEYDPPPPQSIVNDERLANRFRGRWTRRKPACGRYNCAGHVWASRRTSILDPALYNCFIADDGFRAVAIGEAPSPGDIVVYVDLDKDNEILHVGRICCLVQGQPVVLSKWNSTSGEFLHSIPDHPYEGQFKVGWKIMTDRPPEASR